MRVPFRLIRAEEAPARLPVASYWTAQGLSGGVPVANGDTYRVYRWGPIEGWVNETLVTRLRDHLAQEAA